MSKKMENAEWFDALYNLNEAFTINADADGHGWSVSIWTGRATDVIATGATFAEATQKALNSLREQDAQKSGENA